MRATTLASRPDLVEAVCGIPYPPDSPKFVPDDLASSLVWGRRVARRWPHLVVALLDGDRPVARGIVVGYRADRDSRPRFPDGGWDQVAVWAAEDVVDGVEADTACALGIAVDPDHLGRGLSGEVLGRCVRRSRRPGSARSSCPSGRRTRRTSPRCRWTSTRRGPGPTGCRRTGGCEPTCGPGDVPGAPVSVSTSQNAAVYVEPNIWVSHRCRTGNPGAGGRPGGV